MIIKFIEAFKRLETSKVRLIFGCGAVGKSLHADLSSLGIEISAFVDNHISGTVCGLNIYDDNYIKNLNKAELFIAVAVKSKETYIAIRHQLETFGLKEGKHFADFGIYTDERMYKAAVPFMQLHADTYDSRYKFLQQCVGRMPAFMPEITPQTIVVPTLDIKITDFCTKNCRHCVQATPYIENKLEYPALQLIEDLDRLLSVLYTPQLSIIGGEPFLHKEFALFLRAIEKLKNRNHIGSILIITNSTVIPNKDVLNALKDLQGYSVILNDYSLSSSKSLEIRHLFEGGGIPYRYSFDYKNEWYDLGNFRKCRNRNEAELKHQYYVCDKVYTILYGGFFYKCSLSGALQKNGIIPSTETECINIRNKISEKELQSSIYSYLYDTSYTPGCNYCDGFGSCSNGIPVGS